jgi:hypothetical protein
MSGDQDLCAVDGKNETYGMSGRLHGRTRASIHGRGTLGGHANKEHAQSPRSIRWLKKEEHGSETLISDDSNMTWINQGRSLGYITKNLAQEYQLAVLIRDLLIKLNRSMLVPATTAITEHSTQSSSTLGQPDLAFLDTACEVSVSSPSKSAIAVAEDVVEVQIGLMLRAIGTPAVGLECHGVVVQRDVARCFTEIASSRRLVSTVA